MKIEVKNLVREFKDKIALNNVSFILENGLYGLLGENGAGKSTFMRILSTADEPTKGEILLNGINIFKMDEEYRNLLGYLPQEFGYYPQFTAKDYLRYIGTLKGVQKQNLEERINQVLEFVNLIEVKNKRISGFSGGMKRRLGIAQSIINDPKILILDEPTAGLDPKERIRFRNIISDMSKDKIILFSTHIVSDIESIANDIVILQRGVVTETGTIESLLKNLNGKVKEMVIKTENLNYYEEHFQIVNIKQESGGIKIRFISNNTNEIGEMEVSPTLEDYFMSKGGMMNE